MALFKRLKLFVNLSHLDHNNLIYEEIWIYKLKTTAGDENVGRYRIRYQKSDNPMMFSEGEGLGPEDYGDIQEAMAAFGPAILCNLDIWRPVSGWKRCLDWMGDPGAHYITACDELNDQFKSFLTGKPILEPFVSSRAPKPPGDGKPKSNGPKKDTGIFDPEPPKVDPNEFDWI